MKFRCYNSKCENYHLYGGRGIKVCEDWKNNFDSFYEWSCSNGYSETLQIDRIDNNGNYEPKNCRWSTCEENCRNKRNNTYYTAFGETKTVKAWAENDKCKVSYYALRLRLQRGWDIETALTTPALNKKISAFNESKFPSEWIKDERCKVCKRTLEDRIKKGWCAEKAITTLSRKKIK
jgi:hypothetical protein